MRVPRSSLRVGAILGGWRVGSHGGAPVGVAWEAVGGCLGVSFGSGEYGGGGAQQPISPTKEVCALNDVAKQYKWYKTFRTW